MGLRLKLHRGWMRAWIASSIVITSLSFLLIFPTLENQTTWAMSGYTTRDLKTDPQQRQFIRQYFSQPQELIPERLRHCGPKGAYLEPLHWDQDESSLKVVCEKTPLQKLHEPLAVAILLSSLLFIVGLVVAWIRRGFRSESERKLPGDADGDGR